MDLQRVAEYEQQQVTAGVNRCRKKNAPWAEGSVWSIVCAMELGLLSESSLQNVSFTMLADDVPLAKTNSDESGQFLPGDLPDPDMKDSADAPRNFGSFWPFHGVTGPPRGSRNFLHGRKRRKRRKGGWNQRRISEKSRGRGFDARKAVHGFAADRKVESNRRGDDATFSRKFKGRTIEESSSDESTNGRSRSARSSVGYTEGTRYDYRSDEALERFFGNEGERDLYEEKPAYERRGRKRRGRGETRARRAGLPDRSSEINREERFLYDSRAIVSNRSIYGRRNTPRGRAVLAAVKTNRLKYQRFQRDKTKLSFEQNFYINYRNSKTNERDSGNVSKGLQPSIWPKKPFVRQTEFYSSSEEDVEVVDDEEDEEDEGFGGDTSVEYDWESRKVKDGFLIRDSSFKDRNVVGWKTRSSIDCEPVNESSTSFRSAVEEENLVVDSALSSSLKIDDSWNDDTVKPPSPRSFSNHRENNLEDLEELPLAQRLPEERSSTGDGKIDSRKTKVTRRSRGFRNFAGRNFNSRGPGANRICSKGTEEEDKSSEEDKNNSVFCKDFKGEDGSLSETPKLSTCGTQTVESYMKEKDSAREIKTEVNDNQEKARKGAERFHEVRRKTRGLTKINKENFVGKLVWGSCSGWWPALIIDAEHAGMAPEPGKLWVYWIGESRISLLNEKTQIEPFSNNLEPRLQKLCADVRNQAVNATVQMLRERLGTVLTKPYHTWIKNNVLDLNELDEMKFYPYPRKIKERLDYLKERNAKVTEKYVLDQKRSPEPKKSPPERLKQLNNANTERLTLKEQTPGVIAWAKIAGHNWWPAMIIDYRDCCMREPSFGCQWIMWYGDYKLSEIHHQAFLKFDKGVEKMREYIQNTKKHLYLMGVLQAAKDYCSRLGCKTDNWILEDVFKYFTRSNHFCVTNDPPKIALNSTKIYEKYSMEIGKKLNELNSNPNVDDERKNDIKSSDALRSVIAGESTLENLCLKCLKIPTDTMDEHPFFKGSLCKECSEIYKPCIFVFGNDGKCFYCTVCAGSGMVVICDKEDCPRVYCTACLKYLICPKAYDDIFLEDPWECFLCKHEPRILASGVIIPRSDWKEKIVGMFRTKNIPHLEIDKDYANEKKKIRVLSLFDGLSTGLLVLLKLGINVDVYYASEIDKDALMVSSSHFGDRIIQLGDIRDITQKMINEIAPIDLLIGGSPCNDLSLANPARLGLHHPDGTGILFFEYCRIMEVLKKANRGRRLFWLYENVASMPTEYRLEMNKHLGQEPDVIDSADFSPQHRLRLYWHNLPIEPHSLVFQDQQDVQDVLTPNCNRYALVKKIRTVTTKVNSLKQGKAALKPILMKDEIDSLWITELEEIFGFPRHYTDVKNLSATKRQRLIGKSWSVQTLTAILRSLCPFFECNKDSLT